MVESNQKGTNENVFNQIWVQQLVEGDVFEGDPSNWFITESNYRNVLTAINVNVTQFEQALLRAIVTNNDQLSYIDFCQLYHKELMKAAAFELRAMDDTNLLETPA